MLDFECSIHYVLAAVLFEPKEFDWDRNRNPRMAGAILFIDRNRTTNGCGALHKATEL